MHLGMPECHKPFLGLCDLDLRPSFQELLCPEHISYIIWCRNTKFGVVIPLRMGEWCIHFWVTLTVTLTSGFISRFFVLYNSCLSSNVSYAWPIPSPSISAFKHKLYKDIKKPPQYYCGKRLGQVHHTRLRLNCSSLHQNLFSKNIINDPYCECGEIEDTEHYLLNCNLYQNLSEELLNTVTTYCQPTLNVLLYGNANLSDSENKTIFSAVQEFILKTKRFWTTTTTYFITHNTFVISSATYASCLFLQFFAA